MCIATCFVLLGGCESLDLINPPAEDAPRVTPIYGDIETDFGPQNVESGFSDVDARSQPKGFYQPGTTPLVSPPKEAVSQPAEGEITLNFQQTPIDEVVQVILGELLGASYIIDPTVEGSVSMQTTGPLGRDALQPMLELLLRMNEAALLFDGSRYQVVPRASALQGPLQTQLGDSSNPLPAHFSVRVVPLRFVSATEMQNILSPFTAEGTVLRVDLKRNLLVLAGPGTELAQLLGLVDVFDVDWISGMSVALFVPDFVDAKTLSEELQQVLNVGEADADLFRLVTVDRLNGLLVITPSRELLEQARLWVDRLDQDSGNISRQLFVYRVQHGKAADIAEVIAQVFGLDSVTAELPDLAPGLEPVIISTAPDVDGDYTPAEVTPPAADPPTTTASSPRGLRITADEINNALFILATPREYRQVRRALTQLDLVPLQVLIEATIAEITLTDELQHGLEWFFKNSLGSKSGTGTLDIGAAALAPLVPGFSYAVTDAAGAVRAVLNTLASDSRLNIVSSPSLMVLNNQQASIRVGDEIPITVQQQQATVADSTVVNSIEYRDTGVLLTVTPRVNPGGLVVMDIEQEVSDVAPGARNLTPVIQQRKINSTVAIQSGQTVVLGGLIRENKSETKSGLPGLYQLPLFGPLFGTTSENQRRTELVVLITPKAIQDTDGAREITDDFREKMRSLEPLSIPEAANSDANPEPDLTSRDTPSPVAESLNEHPLALSLRPIGQ